MNLLYILLAIISASASLTTAAPAAIIHTTVNGGEVAIANAALKPVSQSKRSTSTRFRTLVRRRLRNRAAATPETSDPRRKKKPSGALDPDSEARANPRCLDGSEGNEGVCGATPDNTGELDKENRGVDKGSKQSKKPKTQGPNKNGAKKGGEDDSDDTGSDDDPGTDNASENESGTDDDDN